MALPLHNRELYLKEDVGLIGAKTPCLRFDPSWSKIWRDYLGHRNVHRLYFLWIPPPIFHLPKQYNHSIITLSI